jgi:hypothetical protein
MDRLAAAFPTFRFGRAGLTLSRRNCSRGPAQVQNSPRHLSAGGLPLPRGESRIGATKGGLRSTKPQSKFSDPGGSKPVVSMAMM